MRFASEEDKNALSVNTYTVSRLVTDLSLSCYLSACYLSN